MTSSPALLLLAAGAGAQAQALPDYVEMIRLPLPNDNWVWLGAPEGVADRVFAMEGGGTIRVLDVTRDAAGAPVFTLRATPLLTQLPTSPQARSVEFAPDFATSGLFYVASEVVAGGGELAGTELVEYRVSTADPDVTDPSSRRRVWKLPGLTFDHAFGSMHFGADGFLYIGIGDRMQSANAQNRANDYGKLMRISVQGDDFAADTDRNYTVPAGNPLPDNGTNRREIWAQGLRNPWRWAFDRWHAPEQNGDLWIFDVGGGTAGEVTSVAGNGGPLLNYGWPYTDGATVLTPPPAGITLTPALVGIQRQAGRCSTSGGARYRGSEIRPFRDRAFWSDYCGGGVYTWRVSPGGASLLDVQQLQPQLNLRGSTQVTQVTGVSMLAEDGIGELYVLQGNRGSSGSAAVYRLVPGPGQPLIADVAGPGQSTTPDNAFTADDIIVFLNAFFAGAPEADFGGPGQSTIVDQALTADDIIVFLNAFFDGR